MAKRKRMADLYWEAKEGTKFYCIGLKEETMKEPPIYMNESKEKALEVLSYIDLAFEGKYVVLEVKKLKDSDFYIDYFNCKEVK